MKRLFFSLAAIIVAGFAVAFTAPTHNKNTNAFFEFNSSVSPTLLNVEDESNWVMVSSLGSCNNTKTKACRIEVLPEYVDGSTLLPEADIQAEESSSGIAFVNPSTEIPHVANRN